MSNTVILDPSVIEKGFYNPNPYIFVAILLIFVLPCVLVGMFCKKKNSRTSQPNQDEREEGGLTANYHRIDSQDLEMGVEEGGNIMVDNDDDDEGLEERSMMPSFNLISFSALRSWMEESEMVMRMRDTLLGRSESSQGQGRGNSEEDGIQEVNEMRLYSSEEVNRIPYQPPPSSRTLISRHLSWSEV